jgi:hypothetical protein
MCNQGSRRNFPIDSAEGKQKEPKAFFCADQQRTGLSIILTFMLHWSVECTFEEAHVHLGLKTQRQWSDLAIERSWSSHSPEALFLVYEALKKERKSSW